MLGEFTLVIVAVVVLFVTFIALISRYKRCPSDKILVIYGRTGGKSARCIHGGGAFIWPVIQDFAYLDLKPMSIEANLNKRSFPSEYPCGCSLSFYNCNQYRT